MDINIQIALISAISALVGSIVGGLIGFFTVSHVKDIEWKQKKLDSEILKREKIYSELLAEATEVILKSFDMKESSAVSFSKISSITKQIELFASHEVAEAANHVLHYAMNSHVKDDEKSNLESTKFLELARAELDVLKKEKA